MDLKSSVRRSTYQYYLIDGSLLFRFLTKYILDFTGHEM